MLALDLGTNTGCAIRTADGRFTSGYGELQGRPLRLAVQQQAAHHARGAGVGQAGRDVGVLVDLQAAQLLLHRLANAGELVQRALLEAARPAARPRALRARIAVPNLVAGALHPAAGVDAGPRQRLLLLRGVAVVQAQVDIRIGPIEGADVVGRRLDLCRVEHHQFLQPVRPLDQHPVVTLARQLGREGVDLFARHPLERLLDFGAGAVRVAHVGVQRHDLARAAAALHVRVGARQVLAVGQVHAGAGPALVLTVRVAQVEGGEVVGGPVVPDSNSARSVDRPVLGGEPGGSGKNRRRTSLLSSGVCALASASLKASSSLSIGGILPVAVPALEGFGLGLRQRVHAQVDIGRRRVGTRPRPASHRAHRLRHRGARRLHVLQAALGPVGPLAAQL